MNQNSKEFRKLQAKWDKKLKDSGFEDIETNREYEYIVSNPVSKKYQTLSKDEYFQERIEYHNSVKEYYSMASGFLHTHNFSNQLERTIWYLHSEGKSYREIAKSLRKGRRKLTKDDINKIVKPLAELMLKELLK